MEKALSIRDVANKLNISESTVRKNRVKWGFFRMSGSRMWRIYPSDLDQNLEKVEDISRLYAKVGDLQEKPKCRSEKTKTAYGKSILPRQTASEFDAAVKRLTENSLNTSTTS